jgi:P27 family predicted phage terminase small subunit
MSDPLPLTERAWTSFWESDVAAAVDPATDLPGLYRYIVAFDEYLHAVTAMRRKRVVRGSTGQPVVNPIAGYIAQREAELSRAETAFGLNPRARAALGLIFGEAKLTAARLNEMTRDRHPASPEDIALAGEWEPA